MTLSLVGQIASLGCYRLIPFFIESHATPSKNEKRSVGDLGKKRKYAKQSG
ncbi:hypothetical protein Cenrod_0633 [Candidatus Symbiobacter mobilis CR]|uniref:Uncharacterized protein n=1 Tax=Candidatus Symbiobacter mobilis CR TaxID=946483 RepID=U5N5E9_9BURK|nr:hypothetical protein Cenrod_0633 [Candidatus Symbiobacter mobilis CR]